MMFVFLRFRSPVRKHEKFKFLLISEFFSGDIMIFLPIILRKCTVCLIPHRLGFSIFHSSFKFRAKIHRLIKGKKYWSFVRHCFRNHDVVQRCRTLCAFMPMKSFLYILENINIHLANYEYQWLLPKLFQ